MISDAIKILRKIRRRILWLYYELFWMILLLRKRNETAIQNKEFSIGITTFKERYHIFFKKLLKRITYLFPDTEIIVAVNGNYNKNRQSCYLKKIKYFCNRFKNVKTISYLDPRGLSKLWNQTILNATNKKIFVINDDIKISPFFRKDFIQSGILNERVATIRNSWSYYLISKEIILNVGWFDERMLEIGGEDDDYLIRLAVKGISVPSFNFRSIQNYSHKLKVNSYGHDMSVSQPYSSYNTSFFKKKWHIRETPEDGYIFSRGKYWKLKKNMITPNFYSPKLKKIN